MEKGHLNWGGKERGGMRVSVTRGRGEGVGGCPVTDEMAID